MLVALVGAACSAPPVAPLPTPGRRDLQLSIQDDGRTAGVARGGAVVLTLPRPVADARWVLSPEPDPAIVAVETRGAATGATYEMWRFRAVGYGTTIIEMAYLGDASPLRTFRLIVSVT